MMKSPLDPLVLDLIDWIGENPRPYAEVIDAWRTSCPRLTVWEDAIDRGLIERRHSKGGVTLVVVTDKGRELVKQRATASAAIENAAANSATAPTRH